MGGFYKAVTESEWVALYHGPNFVDGPYGAYFLRRKSRHDHTYPVDGWFWFDSEDEAVSFFKIDPDLLVRMF